MELKAAGAFVIMGDIEIDPAYKELTSDGSVETIKVDLSEAGSAEKLVRAAIERFGALDILINNLGTTIFRPGFLDTTDEEGEFTYKTNFMSNVRASRAAMPHLIKIKRCYRQPRLNSWRFPGSELGRLFGVQVSDTQPQQIIV